VIQSVQSHRDGRGFSWFPAGGFGLFTSLLLALATGFFTFFLTTCLAIFWLLFWNGIRGHSVNYADSYLYVGLPAGLTALSISLVVLAALWLRAKMR
jgi:hypothetical protein